MATNQASQRPRASAMRNMVALLVTLPLALQPLAASTHLPPAQLMLQFVSAPADAAGFGARYGLDLVRLHPLSRLYVYRLRPGADAAALVEHLAADPAVALVEIDQTVHAEVQP